MSGVYASMLQERRIHISKSLISRDAPGALVKLREQLEVYSYQFKDGETPFSKQQMSLGGKIGGMRDDIAICAQLVVYWSGLEVVPQ